MSLHYRVEGVCFSYTHLYPPLTIHPDSATPHDQNLQKITVHRCHNVNGESLLLYTFESSEFNTQATPQHSTSSPSYPQLRPILSVDRQSQQLSHHNLQNRALQFDIASPPRFPSPALIRRPPIVSQSHPTSAPRGHPITLTNCGPLNSHLSEFVRRLLPFSAALPICQGIRVLR